MVFRFSSHGMYVCLSGVVEDGPGITITWLDQSCHLYTHLCTPTPSCPVGRERLARVKPADLGGLHVLHVPKQASTPQDDAQHRDSQSLSVLLITGYNLIA